MKIGSQHDFTHLFETTEELSTAMPDRIREAHRLAGEAARAPVELRAGSAPVQDRSQINASGAYLRAELTTIVEQVLFGGSQDTIDVIDQAISLIVDHRLQSLGIDFDQGIRQAVMDEMSHDPVVVAELDDLLQTIARQLSR